MFQAGMSRIQALAGRAVETLEDLLGAKQYPAVRLGAARTVAEIGMHQYDADTILRKPDRIEAAAEAIMPRSVLLECGAVSGLAGQREGALYLGSCVIQNALMNCRLWRAPDLKL